MTTGWSAAVRDGLLSAVFNGVPFSVPAVFVQLHIGDPGGAGTSAPALNTTRVEAPNWTLTAGVASNDDVLTWADVADAEDYTHVSLWDAATGGTFLQSGTITANPLLVGDDFVLDAGAITSTQPVAS